jgi:hypothetical protein
MKIKKVRYIGYVIEDQGFWHEGERVKFTPNQYNQSYKAKRIGSHWEVLKTSNVNFISKEITRITKKTKEKTL